ncbi:MAG: hypothetical protein JXA67_07520, partial [Micromonosporaceae bacterium]|nr:hypothetical protein [Micromonosporaceae bacterium]
MEIDIPWVRSLAAKPRQDSDDLRGSIGTASAASEEAIDRHAGLMSATALEKCSLRWCDRGRALLGDIAQAGNGLDTAANDY